MGFATGELGGEVTEEPEGFTVHIESDRYLQRVLQELGTMQNANDPERGLVRGVALNPGTPLELLEPLLDDLELILLLAVNPGFSGQRFATSTPQRLERVRRLVEDSGQNILIAVDGGITRQNIGEVTRLGPDLIVTGSAVFDGRDPVGNARFMLEAVAKAVGGEDRRPAPS